MSYTKELEDLADELRAIVPDCDDALHGGLAYDVQRVIAMGIPLGSWSSDQRAVYHVCKEAVWHIGQLVKEERAAREEYEREQALKREVEHPL